MTGFVDPTAWLDKRATLGDDVRIGPGALIGVHGFGYAWEGAVRGWVRKGEEFGVRLDPGAEVGAGAIIARGSYRDTVIGAGTKIDAGVFVAHNVLIGLDCLIIAKAELSGSVVVGDYCWVGPNAAVREHLTIGPGAVVGIGAVVVRDVEPYTTVAGNPARPLPGKRGIRDLR
jgi:UDP-3-O-[3-hydroxymyristoyl] glucosamine N-acyltransferase